MNLNQLECFVRIAELGSYTRASVLMARPQPTLSRSMRNLEFELSHRLFLRNGRGVVLTDEGRLFLSHAKALLAQYEHARRELDQLKRTVRGNVIVAVPPIVGRMLAAQLVPAFRNRFPHASLEIMEGKSSSIHEWLLMGRVDMGVWYNPECSPQIDVTPLVRKELYLVSSKKLAPTGGTIEFRSLERVPLILPSRPNTLRVLIESAAASLAVKLNVPMQVTGVSFILDLVEQEHGHTILPKYIVEESAAGKSLCLNQIVAPALATVLSIAVPAKRPLTKLAQGTTKLIKSILGPGSDFDTR